MAITSLAAWAQESFIAWETLGHHTGDDGKPHYTQRFTIQTSEPFEALAFNMFARKMRPVNPLDSLVEIVPGYYAVYSPRFEQIDHWQDITVDIDVAARLINSSYAADGMHLVKDGKPVGASCRQEPLGTSSQWAWGKTDPMPYGPQIYDFNESIATDSKPGVYDIIPSPSAKTFTGGRTCIEHFFIEPTPGLGDTIRVDIRDGMAVCQYENQPQGPRIFIDKILAANPTGTLYPQGTLTWVPDMPWRGLMIDVARNFQRPLVIKYILGLMAGNGLNKLHFHLVDDEAWRLDIKGLPELVQVGARRGWGKDETHHLYQIFCGNGNPDAQPGPGYSDSGRIGDIEEMYGGVEEFQKNTRYGYNEEELGILLDCGLTSNGYYTREEFKDLLKYAHNLGISVIPEIESPGHARAAIRAMERRALDGDASFLLSEGAAVDTSRYTSAQSFHDNVMNPALPGPYKFMETVIDDIIAMYNEAGVPLEGIHIGGDEVPRGAWSGSPAAQKFMADNNIDSERGLHAHFVRQLGTMLARRGVPMHGWQEVALDHGADYDAAMAPIMGGVNCWSTLVGKGQEPIPARVARAGYPAILSNVDHLYFDLAYSSHPMEPGLTWGGTVDEFAAFSAYVDSLCPGDNSNVIGLQGQVFAETIRSGRQLGEYLMPKLLGLAERSWHRNPTYTKQQFNAIVGQKELPMALFHHVGQPGIKCIDGNIHMNAPYPGGEILFAFGDDPVITDDPLIYKGPFDPADYSVSADTPIRAVYRFNHGFSVETYYNKDCAQ